MFADEEIVFLLFTFKSFLVIEKKLLFINSIFIIMFRDTGLVKLEIFPSIFNI